MPEFWHKEQYSLDFIETLGRTMPQSDCEVCSGSGFDINEGFVAIDISTGDVLVGGDVSECDCCEGRGWHYVVILT